MSNIVHNTLAWISLFVSKATLRPTRAPNKTAALDQEWAVWSKPTLDLMHVTLTARKPRVYSKLVFKTNIRRHCVIGFGNCPSGTWSFIVKHNALTHNRRRFGQQQLSCSCRRAKLWLAELFSGLRSLSPRQGNRNVQYYSDSILPEPGDGWPRLGTELAESNGGDGLHFASALIGSIVFNIIYKMDSKIGFEMNLIVVEAIRGRCASFTVLTATVSEIFGG